MKIAIWGKEFNAWVAAASLASTGNDIVLHSLTSEDLHYDLIIRNEPNLYPELLTHIQKNKINFIEDAFSNEKYDVHWLCYGANDFTDAENVIKKLTVTQSPALFINQSYCEIGATDKFAEYCKSHRKQYIAYIPSMLSEGIALKNFQEPPLVIAGCDYPEAMHQIRALFRPFLKSTSQLQIMSAREAEFTKLATNGMLALRIGYINEMASLADTLNVDIGKVHSAMIQDQRIGSHYLEPGCGFGGNAFSTYIKTLVETLHSKNLPSLLNTLLTENERHKETPFRKLWKHYDCNIQNKDFTLWGAAFKPMTANINNAPSLRIIDALLAQGCKVHIHDPAALDNLRKYFSDNQNIYLYEDPYAALSNSDGLIIATEWKQYLSPDYQHMRKQMKEPVIFDGRNIYDRAYLQALGFTYYGIGR